MQIKEIIEILSKYDQEAELYEKDFDENGPTYNPVDICFVYEGTLIGHNKFIGDRGEHHEHPHYSKSGKEIEEFEAKRRKRKAVYISKW